MTDHKTIKSIMHHYAKGAEPDYDGCRALFEALVDGDVEGLRVVFDYNMDSEPQWIQHDGSPECPVCSGSGFLSTGGGNIGTWPCPHCVYYRALRKHKQEQQSMAEKTVWDGPQAPDMRPRQWRGPEDGLPPVGWKGECKPYWHACEIVAYHKGCAVVYDEVEPQYFRTKHPSFFRPIQSPEDRAVEAMQQAFASESVDDYNSGGLRGVYRAIRDGKIPGVRLEDK